jgi:sulfate adenylyltransferase subunit 2
MPHTLNHLKELEAEAIYVLRETAAQFERPAILFSGGKDSICVTHLAKKAFFPGKIPFPLIHIDTGHNFQEALDFRDDLVKELGVELIVGSVQAAIDSGLASEETGVNASRNTAQIPTLLKTLEDHQIDAALGGGRRDEEKARAKERFFSHRDEFGQWDPKNQRPELWNIFNGKKQFGESFRVFPISNWTELDVWQYIAMENIALPSLYFAHKRRVFMRNGVWLAESPYITLKPDEEVVEKVIRYRTLGDATITGAYVSDADNLDKIIQEVAAARVTERGGRADDKRSETAMEDRKKEGYF